MKHRTLTDKEWHVMNVLWQHDGPELTRLLLESKLDSALIAYLIVILVILRQLYVLRRYFPEDGQL